MSHKQHPDPEFQHDTAVAAAPVKTPPGLDATIARIEQGSRDMQQYLDSIDEKISRIEPHIERLRQPSREELATDARAEPPTLETDPATAVPPGPTPRRRRSDHDGFPVPPGDRRRSERLNPAFPSEATFNALPLSWQNRLRSPRVRSAGVVLGVILVLGLAWLLTAALRRPSPQVSSADVPAQGTAADPSQPPPPTGSASTETEPNTAASIATRQRPSAAVPSAALSPESSSGLPPGDVAASSASVTPGVVTAADDTSPVASDPDTRIATSTTVAPTRAGQVRVSSGIMAANLIYSRQPAQPGGLARLFHLSGRVTMQVVVSRAGRVINIRVLSGHRLLRGPAKDAVSTWRYRPFLVNGSPVDVATIVSVDFHR